MSIQVIKEIDLAQIAVFKAIPSSRSNRDKYIAKDFVLVLGDVKIKLSKNDTLPDVVRKVNLKSHVTGIRAKAAKGQLFLESTRRARNQSNGILLKQQPSYVGMPLDANQIIANYLNSLKPKNTVADTEIAVNNEVNALCDLMHLCSINEEAPPAPVEQAEQLPQIDAADKILEDDDNELPQLDLQNTQTAINLVIPETQEEIDALLEELADAIASSSEDSDTV